MNVSIGINLKEGPWGGANQFGHSLCEYLESKGIKVFFDLDNPLLDIIVMMDPRKESASASYSPKDILNYQKYVNYKAIVVHRINECDERKGTKDVNRQIINANLYVDHTVFVSTWLRELFEKRGLKIYNSSIILNGANTKVFNCRSENNRLDNGPIRLVTHHWSSNWLKGFDIYQRLDEMLLEKHWKDRILFTYIGQLPDGFNFTNTQYFKPLIGFELSKELRLHHIYVTASRNEPGGNHQNEGAICGLPLLYIKSGCMPEYCNDFGISFTPENFEKKLEEMIENYDYWEDKMKYYPHTSLKMCDQYDNLFKKLLVNRKKIISNRRYIQKTDIIEKI